jgi:UDP-3-O-[3-hydroxymyristoyl] glucosamine N-acyltransferase
VGVAGSTIIGKYCAFGGQAGFAGHLKIADKVRVGGQAGVQHDILEEAATYFGTPAMPIRDWQKQNIAIKKLLKQKEDENK